MHIYPQNMHENAQNARKCVNSRIFSHFNTEIHTENTFYGYLPWKIDFMQNLMLSIAIDCILMHNLVFYAENS